MLLLVWTGNVQSFAKNRKYERKLKKLTERFTPEKRLQLPIFSEDGKSCSFFDRYLEAPF